jgi:hypothetical protein
MCCESERRYWMEPRVCVCARAPAFKITNMVKFEHFHVSDMSDYESRGSVETEIMKLGNVLILWLF